MDPARKEIYDCGILENASKEAEHPVRFNKRMNEYYLSLKNNGQMMIYYCPFCGGSTPKSRRSFFLPMSHKTKKRGFINLLQAFETSLKPSPDLALRMMRENLALPCELRSKMENLHEGKFFAR
jgi:hypothetical protein